MTGGLMALVARLERRRGLLGIIKLGNVGLGMVWGFVVTFVFVRMLPIADFRAFLLLVAFGNFTISAELGITTVVYSRLRRSRLAAAGDPAQASFRNEELGVLLMVLHALILIGALIIGGALASGIIPTGRPWLFLAFYGALAFNLVSLLARRALAALDHNLWWEAVDLIRRLGSIALLVSALFGLPIMASVLMQFALAMIANLLGLMTIQRALGMPVRHWWSLRAGAAHVRAHYLADFGRTSALTLSDIAAYNAPYFTIVAATHDPRPLLLFDFIFKVSRALSALIRAVVETLLPDLTRDAFAGALAAFRRGLRRCLVLALGLAGCLSLLMLAFGPMLSNLMFDGRMRLDRAEIALLILLLLGLTLICVSVYVHNGLGRFATLVPPSFAFLTGSLASVPIALALAGSNGMPFSVWFALVYALVHVAMAGVHGGLLVRLARRPLR